MIAENTTPEPEYSGGLGGVVPIPRQDNRLIKQAIRNRWNVSDDAKARALKATLDNLTNEDGHVVNAAVRNLIAMESQNMDQEEKDNPTVKGSVVLHVGAGIEHERTELLARISGLMSAGQAAGDATAGLPGLGDSAAGPTNGHLPPHTNGEAKDLP